MDEGAQRNLEMNGKGPAQHQATRTEFPLRQFVKCAKCGRGLTAGIVKKKFGYYWCYHKGCRAVLVPKDELEDSFIRLLAALQPTLEYLNRLPEVAARQWEERKGSMEQEVRILQGRLNDQTSLNSSAVKAKLRGELSEEDFRSLKSEIADETKKIQDALQALKYERKSLEEAAQQTKLENVSFVDSWRNTDVVQKIELQKALFPDGLVWGHEMGFLNHQNKWLIEDLSLVFEEFARKPMTLDDFAVKFGVPDGI